MIIDSHCHLDYEPLNSDVKNILINAKKNGVKYLLTISTKDKSFSRISEIIENWECVYGTYGIHPHEAGKHMNINKEFIKEKIISNKKFIGIGETGLDFYYNNSEKNNQIQLFKEHIKASLDLQIPLIIHSRSAENETAEILSEYKKKYGHIKFVLHCFTGSKNFAEKIISLGGYISASGIVTFKKSKELAKIFKDIPNDKLLVETDSPYLSPEPLRGKSNQPSHITHTVKFLANIKNLPFNDFSKITSNNFFKLFDKMKI